MSDNQNHLQFYAERYRTQEQTIKRLREDGELMRKTLAGIADENSGRWGWMAFETLRAIRKRAA